MTAAVKDFELVKRTPLATLVNWLIGDGIAAANALVPGNPRIPIIHSDYVVIIIRALFLLRKLTSSEFERLNPRKFRRSVPGCESMNDRINLLIDRYQKMAKGERVDPEKHDEEFSEMEIDVLYFLVVLCIGCRESDAYDVAIVPLYPEVNADVRSVMLKHLSREDKESLTLTIQHVFGSTVRAEAHKVVENHASDLVGEFERALDDVRDERWTDRCVWMLWAQYETRIDYLTYSVGTHGAPNFFRIAPPEGAPPSAPIISQRSKLISCFENDSAGEPILNADVTSKNAAFKEYLKAKYTSDDEEEEVPRPKKKQMPALRFENYRGKIEGVAELVDSNFELTTDNLRCVVSPEFRYLVLDLQRRGSKFKVKSGSGILATHRRIQFIVKSLAGKTPLFGHKGQTDCDDGDGRDWVLFAVVLSSALDGAMHALRNMEASIDALVTVANSLDRNTDWSSRKLEQTRVIGIAGIRMIIPAKFFNELRWVSSPQKSPESPEEHRMEGDAWLRSCRDKWETMTKPERADGAREILVRWLQGFSALSEYISGKRAREKILNKSLLSTGKVICDAFSKARSSRGGVNRLIEILGSVDIVKDFSDGPKRARPSESSEASTSSAAAAPKKIRRMDIAPVVPHIEYPAVVNGKPVMGAAQLIMAMKKAFATEGDVIVGDAIADVSATMRQSIRDPSGKMTSETVVSGAMLYATFVPKELFFDDVIRRRHINAEAMTMVLRTKISEFINPVSRRILELALKEEVPTQLFGIDEDLVGKTELLKQVREEISSNPNGCNNRMILLIFLNSFLSDQIETVKRIKDSKERLTIGGFPRFSIGEAPKPNAPFDQVVLPDGFQTPYNYETPIHTPYSFEAST